MPDLPFQEEEKIPIKTWLKLAVLVIVIAVSITATVLVYGRADCADQKCFLNRASSCQTAIYTNQIGNLFFLYEIKDGCTLQKSVVAVDDKEPQEVVNLFNGRSMVCKYTQNNFNPDYLTKITGGLGSCAGELQTVLETIK